MRQRKKNWGIHPYYFQPLNAKGNNMAYHTVISKAPDGIWAIQFGDYDKECAQEEMRDMKNNGYLFPKGTKFKIMTTKTARQSEINKQLLQLNQES